MDPRTIDEKDKDAIIRRLISEKEQLRDELVEMKEKGLSSQWKKEVEMMREIETLKQTNHELNAMVGSLQWSLNVLVSRQKQNQQTLVLETVNEVQLTRPPPIKRSASAPGVNEEKQSVSLTQTELATQNRTNLQRMSSEFRSLAEKLAEEVVDKEAQIMHLNGVKKVLGDRVRELEAKNKTLRSSVIDESPDAQLADVLMAHHFSSSLLV